MNIRRAMSATLEEPIVEEPEPASERDFERTLGKGRVGTQVWIEKALAGDPWAAGETQQLMDGYRTCFDSEQLLKYLSYLGRLIEKVDAGTATTEEMRKTQEGITMIVRGEIYRIAKKIAHYHQDWIDSTAVQEPMAHGVATEEPIRLDPDLLARHIYGFLRAKLVGAMDSLAAEASGKANTVQSTFERAYGALYEAYEEIANRARWEPPIKLENTHLGSVSRG